MEDRSDTGFAALVLKTRPVEKSVRVRFPCLPPLKEEVNLQVGFALQFKKYIPEIRNIYG